MTTPNPEGARKLFDAAYAYVSGSELKSEIDWQESCCQATFGESDLLRETAWVILCSGFRVSVVKNIFDHVSLCFCDWSSAAEIVECGSICCVTARASINNPRKLDAIQSVAIKVAEVGFKTLRIQINNSPIEELKKFPYIGNVTAYHLAKNIGFDMAKDDRHLVRLCNEFGYVDADSLCRYLSSQTGMRVSVIDTILWRFMADGGKSCS